PSSALMTIYLAISVPLSTPTSKPGTPSSVPNGTSRSPATRSSKRGSATPWMRRERMYPTPRPSASVTTLAGKPHIPSKLRVQPGVREAAVVFRETVRSDPCVYQALTTAPNINSVDWPALDESRTPRSSEWIRGLGALRLIALVVEA